MFGWFCDSASCLQQWCCTGTSVVHVQAIQHALLLVFGMHQTCAPQMSWAHVLFLSARWVCCVPAHTKQHSREVSFLTFKLKLLSTLPRARHIVLLFGIHMVPLEHQHKSLHELKVSSIHSHWPVSVPEPTIYYSWYLITSFASWSIKLTYWAVTAQACDAFGNNHLCCCEIECENCEFLCENASTSWKQLAASSRLFIIHYLTKPQLLCCGPQNHKGFWLSRLGYFCLLTSLRAHPLACAESERQYNTAKVKHLSGKCKMFATPELPGLQLMPSNACTD